MRRPGSEHAAECVRPPQGHVQPAETDLRESGESDLMRFEEEASPAPRAAESARFFPLLFAAGIVGGEGRACVCYGECRQEAAAAYCG